MSYITEANLAELHHKIRRLDDSNASFVEALGNARSQLKAFGGDPRKDIADNGSILGDEMQAGLLDHIDAALVKAAT